MQKIIFLNARNANIAKGKTCRKSQSECARALWQRRFGARSGLPIVRELDSVAKLSHETFATKSARCGCSVLSHALNNAGCFSWFDTSLQVLASKVPCCHPPSSSRRCRVVVPKDQNPRAKSAGRARALTIRAKV